MGCWPIGPTTAETLALDYFAGNFVVCEQVTQAESHWLTEWQWTLKRCDRTYVWRDSLIRMVTQTEKENKSIVKHFHSWFGFCRSFFSGECSIQLQLERREEIEMRKMGAQNIKTSNRQHILGVIRVHLIISVHAGSLSYEKKLKHCQVFHECIITPFCPLLFCPNRSKKERRKKLGLRWQ